jgi:hypothetical protein
MTSLSPFPPGGLQNIPNQESASTVTLPPAPYEEPGEKVEEPIGTKEHVIDIPFERTFNTTPTPSVEKSVDRAVLRQLESALSEPDKTRIRLLDRISSDELQPKAVRYTLSILSPIPARELLSKDPYYQYAVNFALTYGSYVAPLWPHVTGQEVHYSDSSDIRTALGFILNSIDESVPSQKARDIRATSVLEKVLLNTDSLFRDALITLERELLNAQLEYREGVFHPDSREFSTAFEQTLCFLPVTASQRYRFHLGLTGD